MQSNLLDGEDNLFDDFLLFYDVDVRSFEESFDYDAVAVSPLDSLGEVNKRLLGDEINGQSVDFFADDFCTFRQVTGIFEQEF